MWPRDDNQERIDNRDRGAGAALATGTPSPRSLCSLVLLALAAIAVPACGMTTDPAQGESASQVLSGMPACEESLLHPRISVGAAASLPGKLIVYVDGIMACVDDAAKVDQIVSRVESRFPREAPRVTAATSATAPR